MTALRIGFLPLSDVAPLAAAVDFGFATAEGVSIELHKDVSWANLRDRLLVGQLDAAHMLGALAISTSLGIGQRRFPLRAPMLLSRGGNAITLGSRVAEELLAIDPQALADWRTTARTLARALAVRRAQGKPRMVFGTVFPFSIHTYLLRRFFAAGKIDLDGDIEIVVTPPPYTVEQTNRGLIDGFCVGSPWSSLAVESGTGVIAALGSEILGDAPDKALAVSAASPLLETRDGEALIRAIVKASAWASQPANRDELAFALARSGRIGCSVEMVRRTLDGEAILDQAGRRRALQRPAIDPVDYHRPRAESADWLFDEMIAAGQVKDNPQLRQEARAVFAAGIYERAVAN